LDKLANLKVNISGCPNSCGQHPAADLGFFGKANRKDGELYPAYNVLAGGVIKDEETKLSKKLGEVSAKDLPKLVKEFLADYIKAEEFKTYQDYLASQGNNKLVELCKKYSKVPSLAEDKNYYYDWESKDIFSLAGRGMGECSAGLFDLIDVDLKNIVQTTEKLNNPPVSGEARGLLLFNLVFYATRMLLITRGVEPKVEMDVYTGFRQHFLDTKLVDSSFREVIDAGFSKNHQILLKEEDKISDLVKAVKYLYEHMDNAFGFKVPGLEKKAASDKKERVVKDFRGVACPMNFVKTKLELAKLQSKETLEIYLDDGEPIDNVPGSVKAEGHRIVTQEKIEDYWSVIIEKK
jgi:sulfite reductase (ferredoxin)